MPAPDQRNVRNLLLKALSADVFGRLTADTEITHLPIRHVLVESDQPNEHVCFIEEGRWWRPAPKTKLSRSGMSDMRAWWEPMWC